MGHLPTVFSVCSVRSQETDFPAGRFSSRLRDGIDLEAEGGRAALESGEGTLALLLFVSLLTLLDEGFTASKHEVHHAGELVSSGGIGSQLVHSGAQASIEGAQRGVAVRQGL